MCAHARNHRPEGRVLALPANVGERGIYPKDEEGGARSELGAGTVGDGGKNCSKNTIEWTASMTEESTGSIDQSTRMSGETVTFCGAALALVLKPEFSWGGG